MPLESGWLHHFLFLPFPFLGNESVRVNPASKVTEASKATPFFPLNPLMSRVEPEEKSCSRCWSVSSLFRNLRYTVSPHPLLSQRALFSLTMMCPVLHLGQVNVRAATAGRLRFRISRVALRVCAALSGAGSSPSFLSGKHPPRACPSPHRRYGVPSLWGGCSCRSGRYSHV